MWYVRPAFEHYLEVGKNVDYSTTAKVASVDSGVAGLVPESSQSSAKKAKTESQSPTDQEPLLASAIKEQGRSPADLKKKEKRAIKITSSSQTLLNKLKIDMKSSKAKVPVVSSMQSKDSP